MFHIFSRLLTSNYKHSLLIYLIPLVIIASFFRLYNLDQRGIFTYDEGQLVGEAQFNKSIFVWSGNFLKKITLSHQKAQDVEDMVKNFQPEGVTPRTGRTVHTFLLSLGVFIDKTGVTPGLFMMALFGVGSVILTFYLALILTKSRKIAFLSTFILAILPYHIIYSRSLISETDAQVFFLISLILYSLYLKNKRLIYYFFSSLLIGICFITNGDRITFFAIPLLELILGRKNLLKTVPVFALGFIIPVLLAEIPYHLAFLLTHNLGIQVNIPTYFEQQLWAHARLSRFGIENSLFSMFTYPYFFLIFGGITFCFTFILGSIHLFKLNTKQSLLILVPIVLTFSFQSLYSLKVLRASMQVLPLMAICAAIGIDTLTNKVKDSLNQKRVILILASLFFLESSYRIFPIYSYKNNYREIINFLNSQTNPHILTTSATYLQVYMPNKLITPYQELLSQSQTNKINFKKNNYLVTSMQKYTFTSKGKYLTQNLDPNLQIIESSCQPIAIIPQQLPQTLFYLFVFDHNANLKKNLEFIKSFNHQFDTTNNIYDLTKCKI